MDKAKIEQAIRDFDERVRAMDEVWEKLEEVLGATPESPVFEAMTAVAGGYVAALDAAYGIGGWLEWWWLECQLGRQTMECEVDGKEFTVATIDDIVQVVLADIDLRTSPQEIGWLVERGDSPPHSPVYWAGPIGYGASSWTRDHMDAIRLSRKQDAEKVAGALNGNHRACEHRWG